MERLASVRVDNSERSHSKNARSVRLTRWILDGLSKYKTNEYRKVCTQKQTNTKNVAE